MLPICRGASVLLALVLMLAPAKAEKRVALVIGNTHYAHSPALSNPVNDANDIAAALKGLGFDVLLGLDLDKRAFDLKVRDFARAINDADTALFFYAGHGLQVSLKNYLIPVDAAIEGEPDLDFEGVRLNLVLKHMELDREGKTNIVLLDACRDNPFTENLARTMGTRAVNVGHGLAPVQSGVGTFIAFSTQPGNVAADGAGRNSPFAAALKRHIAEPSRNLTAIMIAVRKDVLEETHGRQVPWDYSALTQDFYFDLASASGNPPKGATTSPAADEALQGRLQELEQELKKKSDPEQTAKMVSLAQLKERVRQLQEAKEEDQQLIFETNQKYADRLNDPSARSTLNTEIGKIMLRMTQRDLQQKELRAQITKLESELGLASEQKK